MSKKTGKKAPAAAAQAVDQTTEQTAAPAAAPAAAETAAKAKKEKKNIAVPESFVKERFRKGSDGNPNPNMAFKSVSTYIMDPREGFQDQEVKANFAVNSGQVKPLTKPERDDAGNPTGNRIPMYTSSGEPMLDVYLPKETMSIQLPARGEDGKTIKGQYESISINTQDLIAAQDASRKKHAAAAKTSEVSNKDVSDLNVPTEAPDVNDQELDA